jgi:predicted enzyme related to lactoylglutathione lyase
MADVTAHQPGTFCWVELGTSDDAAAKKFYMDFFDWGVQENDMGEMGTYYIFTKDGKHAAAMYRLMPDMPMPPNWMPYVAVTSVDDTVAKANAQGAQGIHGPMDVYDMGRMAVIKDSQGAHLAIWQAKQHGGIGVRDEANAFCWAELHAQDPNAAKAFYPPLFGWRLKDSPDYTEWHLGEQAVGGMIRAHGPHSAWIPYFAVDDCDAMAAKAKAGGATVFVEPRDIEKVGRFSVIGDPQGAMFAIIKLDFA